MKHLLVLITSCMLLTSCDNGTSSGAQNSFDDLDGATSVTEITRILQEGYGVPALTVITSRGDADPLSAVSGVRQYGSNTRASINDKWHIGSITKSMTATVVAILVEEGKLSWTTTIGEMFPQMSSIDQAYQSVTIEQLLSHTGGTITSLNSLSTWISYYSSTAPIMEQRTKIAGEILAQPATEKGVYAYSNAGYIIVGAMIEKVLGKSWEEVMQLYLFDKLGMNNSGFAAPTGDNPWGHASSFRGYMPIDPAKPTSDNAPVLGPAGTVHVTLEDMHKYLTEHLNGREGNGVLLPQVAYEKLHKPFVSFGDNEGYAMGWSVDGNTIYHSGSNTMWMAQAIIEFDNSELSFAVTNSMGDTPTTAVSRLQQELMGRSDLVE